ncbi:MAG: hypothetical protein A2Y20_11035 [Firmicutes bacterium GWF2_51_9]|nr:MAG: hypothetical protein A2Y20_11035 [Firmicutes bacterium GWF2_51_9]OGS57520.1 MAG: hypothetical protein A2Y19_06630 [Firmicutes bacterium GWE2_51_13]
MERIRIEVCVGSLEDVRNAISCDIDRIELNQALELGGLTPSRALFHAARRMTEKELVVMVRPHNGFAPYDEEEFEMMLDEAKYFDEHGADGIVFGCLNEDRNVDMEQTRRMVEALKKAMPIFHKAFDLCPDLDKASRELIVCGVKRVLTSGGKNTNELKEGAMIIGQLVDRYGKQLEFLPGGGVDEANLLDVVNASGRSQIHMSAKKIIHDPFSQELRMVTDPLRLAKLCETIRATEQQLQ